MNLSCSTLLIFFLFIFIISCNKKETAENSPCTGKQISYAVNVDPLIQSYCNQPGCHASGSTNGPGPLTNYTQVFNARSAIKVQIEAGLMPKNTMLSADERNSILCWIENGAQNN
jgi:hypothetical protein